MLRRFHKLELEVKYGLIKDLPKDGQTYLCSCEPKCTGYVYIEGAGRFCKNDADEIATAIKAQVRTINQLGPIKRKYRWTEQEEDIVKKWVREKGLEYGDIVKIFCQFFLVIVNKVDKEMFVNFI